MTFDIRRAVITADAALLAALCEVETATIGHILSDGFMAPCIQEVGAAPRICGPAYTVSAPGDDGTIIGHAVSTAPAGAVLVIERPGDDRHACWGAVLTAAAQAAGLIGVVLDGYVTDVGEIRASGLPVWCKGRSPLTTKPRGKAGALNIPVTCGGIEVRPNDLVLADENGVCVLHPAAALDIARRSLAIQAAEPGLIAQVRNGARLDELSGALALIVGSTSREIGLDSMSRSEDGRSYRDREDGV